MSMFCFYLVLLATLPWRSTMYSLRKLAAPCWSLAVCVKSCIGKVTTQWFVLYLDKKEISCLIASESGNGRPESLSLGQIEMKYAFTLQESSPKAIDHQQLIWENSWNKYKYTNSWKCTNGCANKLNLMLQEVWFILNAIFISPVNSYITYSSNVGKISMQMRALLTVNLSRTLYTGHLQLFLVN